MGCYRRPHALSGHRGRGAGREPSLGGGPRPSRPARAPGIHGVVSPIQVISRHSISVRPALAVQTRTTCTQSGAGVGSRFSCSWGIALGLHGQVYQTSGLINSSTGPHTHRRSLSSSSRALIIVPALQAASHGRGGGGTLKVGGGLNPSPPVSR
jgi:hypothetical protein